MTVKVTVYRFFLHQYFHSAFPAHVAPRLIHSSRTKRTVHVSYFLEAHCGLFSPFLLLLTKAIQMHFKHPAFRRNQLKKNKKYDDVNCPLMLSSKCKSQCHVRNVYSNSCETQCCCSHNAIMVTTEAVRSTSTGG